MCSSNEDFWRLFGCYIVFTFFGLVLFTACGKKNKDDSCKSKKQKNLLELAKLKEAKHSDIPLPIGYNFVDFAQGKELSLFQDSIKKSEFKSSDFFCYKGNLLLGEVRDYYLKNMERLGWKISDFSNKKEGMIVCGKLHKHCVISIRSLYQKGESQNYICLFVKSNFDNEEKSPTDINAKKLVSIDMIDKNYFFKG